MKKGQSDMKVDTPIINEEIVNKTKRKMISGV